MRFLYFITLFMTLAYGKDSESKRIHIMEKFMFYFNYQIETLVGGDRTFAPECTDCKFNDVSFLLFVLVETSLKALEFVKAIITPNNKPFNWAEPPESVEGMQKQARDMEKPATKLNAQKRLDNRRLMPSIPEDTPDAQQYERLYQLTNDWAKEIKGKIDGLDGDKKEKANKLLSASKIAVGEMKVMRYNGYLNQQLVDAKANPDFGGKMSQFEKKINAKDNGGLEGYKEIDWAKLRKSGNTDLLNSLEAWTTNRNVNDEETRKHLASDQLVEDLRKCY